MVDAPRGVPDEKHPPLPTKITIPIEEFAAYRVALAPLAKIAEAWAQNNLDDEARRWREPSAGVRIYSNSDPEQTEIYSGRGGRRLLTLADCFRALDALTGRGLQPPGSTSNYTTSEFKYIGTVELDGFERVGNNKARSLESDANYLSQAAAHADEGPLGEAAARSILAIAEYWIGRVKSSDERVERLTRIEREFIALQIAARGFPEIDSDEEVTPAVVERIAREHKRMIASWAPLPNKQHPKAPPVQPNLATLAAFLRDWATDPNRTCPSAPPVTTRIIEVLAALIESFAYIKGERP